MDLFIILIIVFSVIGPIVGFVYWIYAIKAIEDHVHSFDNDQRILMDLMNRYSKQARKGKLPNGVNQQVLTKLMSMKNHMSQMDSFRRQRYESKMSGMISDVTSAGFTNFDPGSFY